MVDEQSQNLQETGCGSPAKAVTNCRVVTNEQAQFGMQLVLQRPPPPTRRALDAVEIIRSPNTGADWQRSHLAKQRDGAVSDSSPDQRFP
jgi:hypothetical protein